MDDPTREPLLLQPLLLEAARRSFERYLIPQKLSPSTLRAYRSDLDSFSAALEDVLKMSAATIDVRAITREQLRTAFATLATPLAASSVLRCRSTLNRFYAFLVEDNLLDGNPVAALAKPRRPSPHPKPLGGVDTPERLLLAVIRAPRPARYPWPERDLAVLATALLAGPRVAELAGLDVEDLVGRPGERRISFTGKGDKTRAVPIEDSLDRLLVAYQTTRTERFGAPGPRDPFFVDRIGRRTTPSQLRYLVDCCYRAAGIGAQVPKGALVHALRHTYATRLAEDGATANEIRLLLGHASITTSQSYIDSTATEQRAAAAANRTYRVLDDLDALSPP